MKTADIKASDLYVILKQMDSTTSQSIIKNSWNKFQFGSHEESSLTPKLPDPAF